MGSEVVLENNGSADAKVKEAEAVVDEAQETSLSCFRTNKILANNNNKRQL